MLGINSIKTYVQDQIALVKLEGIEAVGRVVSRIVYLLLITMFAMFFVLLLSFAGAFYLGELYGRGNGFLMVTGIYLLLIILLVVLKKPIQNLILNISIAASMADNNDD